MSALGVEPRSILSARTLEHAHPTLLEALDPGMRVLDVGCGPGALTAQIAQRVAPGWVVGMDVNPEMIRTAEAASPPDRVPNLVFYAGDIRASRWDEEFDLANAARVLQWLPDPERAVARMIRAVRRGGRVVLLDSDHARAQWHGAPEAWRRFHAALLEWRAAAGLDNATADRLAALARAAGLADLRIAPRTITVRPGDADFFRVAGQWRVMIETRGRQLVAAGHLSELERRAALDAYTEWMMDEDAAHTGYETAVVTRRPDGPARRGSTGRARWTR